MFNLRPSLKLLDSCRKEDLPLPPTLKIKIKAALKDELGDLVVDELGKKGVISLGPAFVGDGSTIAPGTTLSLPVVSGAPAGSSLLLKALRATQLWGKTGRMSEGLRSRTLSPGLSCCPKLHPLGLGMRPN